MAQAAFHGNIGKVEEIKFSNDGQARIKFSVGESHSKFDKQANAWKDTGTTWRNVTVFGKRAESLSDVLRNGAKQQVVVIGREETREYDKSDGSGKGYSFDVVADIVGIIPAPQQNGQQPQGGGFGGQQQQPWGGQQQQSQPPANQWDNGAGNDQLPPF